MDTLIYDVEANIPRDAAIPLLLVGPPGTGKTTVARLAADLLYGEGLIERNILIEVSGVSMKGTYLGQTTSLVRRTFDRARDGVLLIDEAYGICTDDRDMYGAEAVNEIIAQMMRIENRGIVVILAGTEESIDHLLRRHPGLGSRFRERWRFADLTIDACASIAERMLVGKSLSAGPGVMDQFRIAAGQAKDDQSRQFGNASWVHQTMSAAIIEMKCRVIQTNLPRSDPRRRIVYQLDMQRAAKTMSEGRTGANS